MPCPMDINRLETRMRDYVEWLGLMAVSGCLAVLINSVALAHPPDHPTTAAPLPSTEFRALQSDHAHP